MFLSGGGRVVVGVARMSGVACAGASGVGVGVDVGVGTHLAA